MSDISFRAIEPTRRSKVEIVRTGREDPFNEGFYNMLIKQDSAAITEIIRQILRLRIGVYDIDARHFECTEPSVGDCWVIIIRQLDKCPAELKSEMKKQLEHLAEIGWPVIAYISEETSDEELDQLVKDFPAMNQLFGDIPKYDSYLNPMLMEIVD